MILVFLSVGLFNQAYSQKPARDSSFHPYHINYWVTGTILGVGLTTNYLGINGVILKDDVSLVEMQALNKSIINNIDSWAFNQDVSKMSLYANYSDYVLTSSIGLPLFLLFDKEIRRDWFDMLLLYLETMSITTNIYEWSFLGPAFQNRLRPVTYYVELSFEERKSGNNRNSFYSGHVASVAASTFFMAKVYSDYHPEIGNNKYLLYGAALIPPVVLGYLRVMALKHFPSDIIVGIGVGALCGIIIPELHRVCGKNVSFGLYSSFEATGAAIKWTF